jgi:mRNA-degrading endonuclease YafQ of YafQ-DinJ toxin-antitoxin module
VYSIVTPKRFLRQARKFFKRHPELKPLFAGVLSDLPADPFQPQLGLYPLSGKLTGCHAVSLTQNYRITLTLLIAAKEIILLTVSSHGSDA